MKKVGSFLFFLMLFYSCSVQKKPIFVKVDSVKVISANSDEIRLTAEVFFKNPNDVGGVISTDDIIVYANKVEVAQVLSEEFKVPARKEFAIPLQVVVSTRKVLRSNKNGILGGLINSLINKSVKVQFKGKLIYKVLGFSNTYDVNKTEEIKL